jgi:hypothetical protein
MRFSASAAATRSSSGVTAAGFAASARSPTEAAGTRSCSADGSFGVSGCTSCMNYVYESRLRRRCVSVGWRNGRRITAISVPEARVYFSGSCEWGAFDVYLSRRSDSCDRTPSDDIGESRLDSN